MLFVAVSGGNSALKGAFEAICARAVDERVTPGGVVAVDDGGRPALTLPFGATSAEPDAEPVTADTVYDAASLTKAVSTAAIAMRLLARGAIELDQPARTLVPELRAEGSEAITLRHLAGHASGFPAHIEFFRRLRAGDRAGAPSAREALVAMAGATPLAYRPGEKTLYSDLGYILFGAALERAGGDRLDRLFAELVAGPLGMTSSFFVDTEAGAAPPAGVRIAPTERCPVRGLVHGAVHDENAHAGGGICGHAGLFSTVGDLQRFARAVCAAATGDASGPFEPAAVAAMLGQSAAPNTTWRLGWDTPDPTPGVSQAGDLWPRDGVGHLGFTGCALWLDPPRRRSVALLTNRVYYSREREPIRTVRRALMDATCRALPV